jgi:hypothetical protein
MPDLNSVLSTKARMEPVRGTKTRALFFTIYALF